MHCIQFFLCAELNIANTSKKRLLDYAKVVSRTCKYNGSFRFPEARYVHGLDINILEFLPRSFVWII